MATLTNDITATDRMVRVSGDLSLVQLHQRYRFEDELVELSGFDVYDLAGGRRPSGRDQTKWLVNRGVGGSTATTHAAGTEVLGANAGNVSGTTLAEPEPFADTGVQTVRLLGPYTVAHNTADLVWTGAGIEGVVLGDEELAEGTVVDAWVINRVGWGGTNNPTYNLVVGVAGSSPASDDMYEAVNALLLDDGVGSNTQARNLAGAIPVPQAQVIQRLLVQSAGSLRAILYVGVGDAPTSGETDIYALIAEPAA